MNNLSTIYIREKWLRKLVLFAFIIGLPMVCISLASISATGIGPAQISHMVALVIVSILLLGQNRFSFNLKTAMLFVTFLGVGVAEFLSTGMMSMGFFIMYLNLVLVALLRGFRTSLWGLIATFLLQFFIALALYKGWISYKIDFNLHAYSMFNWIPTILGACFFSFLTLVIVSDMLKTLHKAVDNLSEQKEQLKLMFENANDGILIIEDNRIIECNNKACSIFMATKDDIIGKSPMALSPESQYNNESSDELGKTKLLEVSASGSTRFEWLHMRSNGQIFDSEISLSLISLNEKPRFMAIIRDISDRKKIEGELTLTNRFLEHAQKLSKIGHFRFDFVTKTNRWSKQLYEIYGINDSENLPNEEEHLKIIASPDVDKLKLIYENNPRSNSPIETQYNIVRGDGQTRTLNLVIDWEKDMFNRIIASVGTIQDITERKKVEEALAQSEARYRSILDNTLDIIFILNPAGEIRFISPSITKYDYFPDEIMGKHFNSFVHPEDLEKSQEAFTQALHIGSSQIPSVRIILPDGQYQLFEVQSKLIFDISEKGYGIMGVLRDITERSLFEKRLLNAIIQTEEKERAKLASDLHDEVGPLLSSLSLYFSMLSNNPNAVKPDMISHMNSILHDTIKSVREISYNLSPNTLYNYGLGSAISFFFESKKDLINIHFTDNTRKQRFSQNTELVFYRIIKELTNNTLKHAKASNIEVQINAELYSLSLSYKDDGIGFEADDYLSQSKTGIGLMNILQRAKSINGEYSFESKTNGGMHFHLKV